MKTKPSEEKVINNTGNNKEVVTKLTDVMKEEAPILLVTERHQPENDYKLSYHIIHNINRNQIPAVCLFMRGFIRSMEDSLLEQRPIELDTHNINKASYIG